MWLRRAPAADRWALVLLRLVVGFGFAAHGYAKLARGPEGFAAILSAIGVPAPHLAAWATVVVELLGGIAMMAGAGVIVLTPLLAAIMVTALFGGARSRSLRSTHQIPTTFPSERAHRGVGAGGCALAHRSQAPRLTLCCTCLARRLDPSGRAHP